MELGNILKSLENRSILVTGSTGFLAKIFVEKILRVQPKVKRLFLIIRAADTQKAKQRVHDEVTGKELFSILREKLGNDFDSFISDKVIPVVGDISREDLGITDLKMREDMWREVNVVVNIAATISFNARYDIALGINTLGARHVLDFAKKCAKVEILLHVSTAYVCGEKSGLVTEKPFQMGEALNGDMDLDIQHEQKLVNERLAELRAQKLTVEEEKFAMKEFGLQRARMYGWPNTYVFTKAMGEMLIGQLKQNLPVAVIRPTVITSTLKEPFPGWVEGIRTIDHLTVGYGMGRVECFLGDPETIVDLIPGDLVVNAMIVAMVANANQPSDHLAIYHIGSSMRNPINSMAFKEYGYRYFTKNPWIGKDGNSVKVSKPLVFTSMDNFYRYMNIRYILPLKGLQLLNAVFCQKLQRLCTQLNHNIKTSQYFIELYKPYIFFKGIFDDFNTERLRGAVREAGGEAETFNFDANCIDWDDYVMNIHIPGVVRFGFKYIGN